MIIHCTCGRCGEDYTVKIGPGYVSNPIETVNRRADHRTAFDCLVALEGKVRRAETDRAGTLKNLRQAHQEIERLKRLIHKERCHRRSMQETWGGITGV